MNGWKAKSCHRLIQIYHPILLSVILSTSWGEVISDIWNDKYLAYCLLKGRKNLNVYFRIISQYFFSVENIGYNLTISTQ